MWKNIFSSRELDFGSKFWPFGWVFCLRISPKFDQNMRKFYRKNIFSSKILLSLKTYSVSSLNTKYEPLTPKTERVSLDFHPKITKMTIFSWKNGQIWLFSNIKISRSKNNFRQKIDLCPKIHPVSCTHAKYERGGAKIEKVTPKSPIPIFDHFFIFFPRMTRILDLGYEYIQIALSKKQ